jgi:hypothetical protein
MRLHRVEEHLERLRAQLHTTSVLLACYSVVDPNGFALPPGPRLLEALGLARPLVLGSRATTAVLKKRVRSQHSITLKSLKDLVRSIGSLEVSFNGLRAAVQGAARSNASLLSQEPSAQTPHH